LKENGIACFSGLQQHDLEEITESLKQARFVIKEQRRQEEWLCLSISR
jgi:ribosomal protein L11 methylase PrmA